MKNKIPQLSIVFLFLLICCRESSNTWRFKVRNNAIFPDAFFLSADFSPQRYKIKAKGFLTGYAKIQYNQINNNDTSDVVIREYIINPGAIDTSFFGDVYVKKMSFIYLPEKETSGNLTLEVAVD